MLKLFVCVNIHGVDYLGNPTRRNWNIGLFIYIQFDLKIHPCGIIVLIDDIHTLEQYFPTLIALGINEKIWWSH